MYMWYMCVCVCVCACACVCMYMYECVWYVCVCVCVCVWLPACGCVESMNITIPQSLRARDVVSSRTEEVAVSSVPRRRTASLGV